MSDTLTYPADGISQLIVETLAGDAILRAAPDAAVIQITFAAPVQNGEPAFIRAGDTVRFAHAAAMRVLAPEGLAVVVREALGDLRVQGLTGHVSLEAVHGDLRLATLAGQVLVAQADGDIRAEGVADLRILGRCGGDLRFIDGGLLSAEAVDGDLRLADAAGAQLGSLHGDLWAERLSGALVIQRSDGDARLSEIVGPVTVKVVAGDLRGQGLTGGLQAEQVQGDLVLSGPFAADSKYTLAGDGDIYLSLPGDADVRLVVQARGRLRSDVVLVPAADGTPTFSATLGQGTSHITATSRGDVRIKHEGGSGKAGRWERRTRRTEDAFADLSNLGDRIRQQVAASLASAGINVDTGELDWAGLRGRGSRFGPRATPPPPPERPKPPAPPKASTEEQLTILKMVEEGRITPEEADTLLRALGA